MFGISESPHWLRAGRTALWFAGIARKRLLETDRIEIKAGNVISIINWQKYQSEYERTSKYRSPATTNATTNATALEDRGKRIDNRVYKEPTEKQFNTFWEAYPKKKNKGQAEKVFGKVNPDEQLLQTILNAIEQAEKSDDWQKAGGRYIPYPATWLNAKGWEDEFPDKKGGQGGAHRGNLGTRRLPENYRTPEEIFGDNDG